jgi:hypothetical protein
MDVSIESPFTIRFTDHQEPRENRPELMIDNLNYKTFLQGGGEKVKQRNINST